MAALTTAAFLCLIGPAAAAPSGHRVDIVFDGPAMPRRLEASAMEEVRSIWAAYGVDVRATGPGESGRADAIRLAVVRADRPYESATQALGSIRFVGDVPEPTITIYPHAIAALVSTLRISGHLDCEWPIALRNAILGRVLGRALAHEIGHFLLRSRTHSQTGLMQSMQVLPDLVALDRRPFTLSAGEAALVVSRAIGE
jgi:hypothetical protein